MCPPPAARLTSSRQLNSFPIFCTISEVTSRIGSKTACEIQCHPGLSFMHKLAESLKVLGVLM